MGEGPSGWTGRQRFSGRAAVVGIGQTALTRRSGRTVLDQAVEACRAAIADAGLEPADVDGILAYGMGDTVPVLAVAKAIGIGTIRWHNDIAGGGTQCASILVDAALAIDGGLAGTVLVYRAMNGRSGSRMGQTRLALGDDLEGQFLAPYGLLGPVHLFALTCQRYLHERGYTELDLGGVAIAERARAVTNERALMRSPLTMDEYLDSPFVASPLRRLDCCLETDGAAALVVTGTAAGSAPSGGVAIHAGVRGGGFGASTPDRAPDVSAIFSRFVAEPLFDAAGMASTDVDVALLYDAYSFLVLAQLEDLGLCAPGAAGELVAGGGTAPTGPCPVNPHGGLLSEGYVHGLNNVTEAVRQLRGEGTNQVPGAAVALCTGFGGGYGSGVVLVRST